MLKLYAGSWAVGQPCPLLPRLILEEVLNPSGLMRLSAEELKLPCLNAVQSLGDSMTVCTEKMLVLYAQVILTQVGL